MTVRRELVLAAGKADTCGMDEAQTAAVVTAVVETLIDRVDSKDDYQSTRDWLRRIRDGML